MNIEVPKRLLYAIEFPAIVKNVDNAITMLGGLGQINEVFANEKRRLNLSFRPNMLYSKVACGDGHSSNGLCVRFQRCRNKKTGEIKLKVTIIGHVVRTYRFEGMADYQYGPFERVSKPDEDGKDRFNIFYDDLLIEKPTTLIDFYLSRDIPLYLPPVLFSRQDVPSVYNFGPRHRSLDCNEVEENNQISIPTSKKHRRNTGYIICPGDSIPTAPKSVALDCLANVSKESMDVLENLRKLFDERPIWLRAALVYKLSMAHRMYVFKTVLPVVAYFMIRGPWSRSWIRFGYDPFKHNEARIYQVLDFRLQTYVVFRKFLEDASSKKRTLSSEKSRLTRKSIPSMDVSTDDLNLLLNKDLMLNTHEVNQDDDLKETIDGDEDEFEVEEEGGKDKLSSKSDYYFGPSNWPTSHQMLYCFVDIELPEVQALINEESSQTICDSTNGWFKMGTIKTIRNLLIKYLKKWTTEAKSEMLSS